MTRKSGGRGNDWSVEPVVRDGQQGVLHYNEISITGAIRRLKPRIVQCACFPGHR